MNAMIVRPESVDPVVPLPMIRAAHHHHSHQ
jgi:hypothetical protein